MATVNDLVKQLRALNALNPKQEPSAAILATALTADQRAVAGVLTSLERAGITCRANDGWTLTSQANDEESIRTFALQADVDLAMKLPEAQ